MLKTSEDNTNMSSTSVIENSSESAVVTVTGGRCKSNNSVHKVGKGNKNKKPTRKMKKTLKSTVEDRSRGKSSINQESNDEQLPKRRKITQKVNDKAHVESEIKGRLSLKGKPIEGQVKIFKNVPDIRNPVKNAGVSPLKRAVKEKLSNEKEQRKEHSPFKEISVEQNNTKRNIENFEDSDEEDDDPEMDWEDVAEVSGMLEGKSDGEMDNSPSTSSNVEVTIKVPGKKSKCGRPSQEEIRKWIQRKINKVKKETQISVHKVHFMTLLAVGLNKNDMCNNSLVQAVGLSLVPNVFTQRNVLKTWDIAFLTRFTTWVKNKAPNPGEIHTGNSEATYLMRVLEKKVYLFIAILRALGLCVRLVTSFQVVSHKVPDISEATKTSAKPKKTVAKSKQTTTLSTTPKQAAKKEEKKTPKQSLLEKLKRKTSPAKSDSPSSNRGLRKKAKVDYNLESEYFSEKKPSTQEFSLGRFSNMSDGEEDFEVSVRTPKRNRTSSGESRRLAESLQDAPAVGETSGVVKKGRDIWLEVYIEKEKKWICIDGDICSINQPGECEKLATKPVKYVMAFDNERAVKDVTCRYASAWLTSTPKLRVNSDWLTETLSFYRTKNSRRDKKEDSLLKARLLQKPLPQTVSEYKNHPLYVLKRHLLKFEDIYPESAATLGFCRGEAVYSRECVHTLHTREMWMKEARVVKTGEQAYKIVKGRKSRRKMLENVGEVKAELFGRWQTEDYIPPPVVDGKVPRNEYGNVELFKPSMLPAGACHIQVPGIHRLARKLNIDAVQAVVGFDFHGGFNHPIIDGVVVSEDFREQLLLAWDKEQQEKIQREHAKREKRALDNWSHLVKSLRIRERLKRKYKMEDNDDARRSNVEENTLKEREDVTDLSLSWPLNKQEGKTVRGDDGHCHVFLPANHVQDPITGEWSKTCACGHKEPLERL